MVGQVGGEAQRQRRLFVARDEGGQVLAYLSFSPVFGSRPGWLHDLSRRRPDAPPGVLELLVVTAVEAFHGEGAGYLHFGMTPFTSLDPAHEVEGASPLTTRIMHLLADKGSAIYRGRPARLQGEMGSGPRRAGVHRLPEATHAARTGGAPAGDQLALDLTRLAE